MKSYFPYWLHKTVIILLWGFIFYVSALLSFEFDDPNSSLAIIWFPSGVAVAAFLCSCRRDYLALIFIFTLMSLLLKEAWKSWHCFIFTLEYSLLAMPASALIAWIVRRFSRPNDDLHIIRLWIFATFIISSLDALIVGGGFAYLRDLPIVKTIWYEFISDVTGIFFATTVVMGFIRSRQGTNNTLHNLLRGTLLFLLLCTVTWFIFGYNVKWFVAHIPAFYFTLSCLPIVLTMMLSIVWRNYGGAIGLLTLGIIVISYTDQQKGPFFLEGLDFTESLLLALVYLSAAALLVVFIRALKRSYDRFNSDNGLFSDHSAPYCLEPITGAVIWERDLFSLFGTFTPEEFSHVDKILPYVHPSDRENLRQHWCAPIEKKHRVQSFRIKKTNGLWVTLVDSSRVTILKGGEPIIVGYWKRSRDYPSL